MSEDQCVRSITQQCCAKLVLIRAACCDAQEPIHQSNMSARVPADLQREHFADSVRLIGPQTGKNPDATELNL